MNFRPAILPLLMCTLGLLFVCPRAWAQDEDAPQPLSPKDLPQAEAAADSAEDAEETEAEFAPKDATEGMERIIKYAQTPTKADGTPIPLGERLETLRKWGDQVWEMDPSLEQKKQLMQLKVQVLSTEQRLGKEESGEELEQFLKQVAESDEPELAEAARAAQLNLQISEIARLDAGERVEAMREITNKILAEKPTGNYVAIATSLANSITYVMEPEEAAPIVEKLASHFAASDDKTAQQQAKRLKGMARRLNLPGNPIELTGTKLNGDDLDWDSYKGKVVLVDFWATWCGPCIAEFPHMKKLYETYHPHGFEIIGINLDDEKQTVEDFLEARELPWTIVWTEKEGEGGGFSDPNATRYGIMAIPTMILVDREGNVESIRARGPALDQLLAEAFPDVDTSAEDSPEETEEAADADQD